MTQIKPETQISIREIAIFRDFDFFLHPDYPIQKIPNILQLLTNIFNDPQSDWNFRILISAAFCYYILEKDVIPDSAENGLYDDFYILLFVLTKLDYYSESDFIKEFFFDSSQLDAEISKFGTDYLKIVDGLEKSILEKVGLDILFQNNLKFYSGEYKEKYVSLLNRQRELMGLLAFLFHKQYYSEFFDDYGKDIGLILSLNDLSELRRLNLVFRPKFKRIRTQFDTTCSARYLEINDLYKKSGSISNIILQKSLIHPEKENPKIKNISKIFKLACNILNDDKCDWWTKIFLSASIAAPFLFESIDDERQFFYTLSFFLSYSLNFVAEELSEEIILNNWQFKENPIDLLTSLMREFRDADYQKYLFLLHKAGLIKYSSLDYSWFDGTYFSTLKRLGSENKQLSKTIMYLLQNKYHIIPRSDSIEEIRSHIYSVESENEVQEFVKLAYRWHNFKNEQNIKNKNEDMDQKVKFLLKNFRAIQEK